MSFKNAYDSTMITEGGYVFDPTDRGGETYKGISRKHNTNWEGWELIDSYKPFNNPVSLYNDKVLDVMVMNFYKDNYWLKPQFYQIDRISKVLAEKMFDTGVNVGTTRVIKWLQSSLNLLNRNAKYYPDIHSDGGIGPITLSTLQEAMKHNPINRILTVLVIHQGEHYKDIMERDKTQEKYVGWFDRLTYK